MLCVLLSFYILLLIGLSVYRSKQTKTENAVNFLTAGASAGTILCALSLVSTIIGGSATLGIGTLAQKIGAAAFWWLGVGAIGLFLHGWLIAPVIRSTGACTLPDVLGHLVGKTAKRWSAFIIVVSWVGVVAAQFTAMRALLSDILPASQGELFYLVLTVAIVLHTAFGGQKAVLRTDALQTALLTGGFVSAALWCLTSAGIDWDAIDPVPFNDSFGAWDLAKLSLLVGVTYIVGPDIFSRTFAASSSLSASRGAWMGAALLLVFALLITLLALGNLSATNPLSGWLTESSAMPSVIKIALALGLLSALAGSADTVLLSAAGIVEKDLLNGDQSYRLRQLIALFGFGAVFLTYQSSDIIGWLLYAYALFVPGVAIPLLVLLLRKQARVNGRIWLFGAAIGGVLGLAGNLTGWPLAILGAAISATFAWVSVKRSEVPTSLVPKRENSLK